MYAKSIFQSDLAYKYTGKYLTPPKNG